MGQIILLMGKREKDQNGQNGKGQWTEVEIATLKTMNTGITISKEEVPKGNQIIPTKFHLIKKYNASGEFLNKGNLAREYICYIGLICPNEQFMKKV